MAFNRFARRWRLPHAGLLFLVWKICILGLPPNFFVLYHKRVWIDFLIIILIRMKPLNFSDLLALVSWLGNLISNAIQIDRNKDKKITAPEILRFISASFDFEFIALAPKMGKALKGILRADREARPQLIAEFADAFEIENEKVEVAIERLLEAGNEFATTVADLTKLKRA